MHICEPYLINPTHPITVAVIGCGGTGSRLLTELVKVHLALRSKDHPGLMVIACDPDMVTNANQARQMFYEEDVGQNKATVLINRINANYGFNWKAIPNTFQHMIQYVTLFFPGEKVHGQGANVIMSCLDKIDQRAELIYMVRRKERFRYGDTSKLYYMFDFGNGKEHGQIILSSHNCEKKRKLRDMMSIYPDVFQQKEKEDEPSCSLAMALNRQSLFINGFLAIHGAAWLYEMITKGFTTRSELYFNMTGPELTIKPIK